MLKTITKKDIFFDFQIIAMIGHLLLSLVGHECYSTSQSLMAWQLFCKIILMMEIKSFEVIIYVKPEVSFQSSNC